MNTLFMIDTIENKDFEYEVILCKPTEEKIAVLNEIKNLGYNSAFPTTDEITFEVPYYITKHGKKIENPNFHLIKGDYLLLVNSLLDGKIVNSKYFIIDSPRESLQEYDTKSIHAYSREIELNKKTIRGYQFTSRRLYSINNEIDDEGEYRGVMNYVTTLTSWSIDTNSFSHPDIYKKFRSFDVSEQTLLDFLINDVQKSFGVVFLFDTVNKKIFAKRIEDLSTRRGLYISDKNYLKSITKDIKHDEIVTRLYCYGKNDLSIEGYNITGTRYIELFDFYKTTEYMTQGLINALDEYEELIKYHTEQNTFSNLVSELEGLRTEKEQLEDELFNLMYGYYDNTITLIDGLTQIEDKIDSRIKLQQDYDDLNILLYNKEIEVLNKQAEIDHDIVDFDILRKHPTYDYSHIVSKQSEIDDKQAEIEAFREIIKKENNFTVEQLKELDYFIREKIWIDNTYETVEELYVEGEEQLLRLAQPPIQFEISSVDFLSIVEGKLDKIKFLLGLGDIVTIAYDKFGIDIEVRLVGYTYNPDNHDLVLKFSNKNSLDDPYIQLAELQKNAITTSTTINMDKYKWDKSVDNTSQIKKIIEQDLDTAKNKVLSGQNQEQEMTRRGIWLYEKDEHGNIMPEQMRLISNMLVISDDHFKSAKLSITPTGFVGDKIKHKKISLRDE